MNFIILLGIIFGLVTYTGKRMWDTRCSRGEASRALLASCVGLLGLGGTGIWGVIDAFLL